MTTFDERERAFEQMFVHDEEMRFRARARRNKLLAAWTCERLGLTKEAASRYMEDFVKDAVAGQDDAGMIAKVRDDLAAAGIAVSDTEMGGVLAQLASRAETEVRKEIRAAS